MITGIKIVAPCMDGSGYGAGSRTWIKSLIKQGIPFWIHAVSFERDRPDLKEDAELIKPFINAQRPYNINFVRLSPEIAVEFLDKNAINICSCAWETTRLHPYWTECCNKFDAIFVESEWLVQVFKDSGVTVPILCTPNGDDATKYQLKSEPNLDKTYTFYSIQQWTERKNGLGLLKAYYRAFSDEEDVSLILKTYMTRIEVQGEQGDVIKSQIEDLKKSFNLNRPYPKVYLITSKLTNEELIQMHEECDCYIMLEKSEGYGLPYIEAACAGNPIIAPDFGGTRQFLNKENSYCVSGQMAPVFNMQWSRYYTGLQDWFEPNILDAADKMRYVYEHKQEAFQIGLKARKDMEERFNLDEIGRILVEKINEVIKLKGA